MKLAETQAEVSAFKGKNGFILQSRIKPQTGSESSETVKLREPRRRAYIRNLAAEFWELSGRK